MNPKKKKKRNRFSSSKKRTELADGKKKNSIPYLTIGIIVVLVIGWSVLNGLYMKPPDSTSSGSLYSLQENRNKLDKTVWAEELEAQEYEKIFIHLWDNLRAASVKHRVLSMFPFNRLVMGKAQSKESLEQGIFRTRFSESGVTLTHEQFKKTINELAGQGYRIIQSEWHHSKFDKKTGGSPVSTVSVVLHVKNSDQNRLQSIKANLNVTWLSDVLNRHVPDTIKITDLEILEREASVAFESILEMEPSGARNLNTMMSPVLVYDLDSNGLSDLIVGGGNRVFFNKGHEGFQEEQIHPRLPVILNTAILADFNGDMHVDLVAVDFKTHRLFSLNGTGEDGRFSEPQFSWSAQRIELPSVITAGDIDADGDLDLFIGQYKQPYLKGQMPSPYYDANDGYPAYLLQNDGQGIFTDMTEQSGLGLKRFRRSYGASFVDMNGDRKIDLLVSSDFAGIDLYEGNGLGDFKDVTNVWTNQRHTFGMSHVFADFNTDGKLDFYSVGMSSTTARRLEFMGLRREEHKEIDAMRIPMSYGNRLYLAGRSGFEQPSFNDQVARTGWSWGSTAFDIDNDADKDIYVANGHQSGKSAQDYCTTFWCHDIYTGDSQDDSSVEQLFSSSMAKLINREISWNGFEHNALLINRKEKGFFEAGFLMGIAFEGDGRVVLGDDLNNDGKQDLVLVEVRSDRKGNAFQTLRVFANRLKTSNHWIGVKLRERGPHFSPVGASVIIETSTGEQVDAIVTGDSLYSQHSCTAHFGLGENDSVKSVEVQWANGATKKLEYPEIDTYHLIDPPK